jgi:aspartate/glutamate racemase
MLIWFYRSKLLLVFDRSEVFATLELVPFVAITGNTATFRWESIDQTKTAPFVARLGRFANFFRLENPDRKSGILKTKTTLRKQGFHLKKMIDKKNTL